MVVNNRIPLYLAGWYSMKEEMRIGSELEVQDQEVGNYATSGPPLASANAYKANQDKRRCTLHTAAARRSIWYDIHHKLEKAFEYLSPDSQYSCKSSGLFNSLPSIPPSTITTWPVTWPERVDDARTTICVAMSIGIATFLSGIL